MKKRRELEYEVTKVEDIYKAKTWIDEFIRKGLKGGEPVWIRLGRARRNKDQNAKLWPMLKDISNQVDWYGEKLQDFEWKVVFTAALKKQKIVPGIDGGFVSFGASTSKMEKHEFCDLIELIYAFGSEHDVAWSEKAMSDYERYGNG